MSDMDMIELASKIPEPVCECCGGPDPDYMDETLGLSAKGVVKCLGVQNESRKVNRNIPNGQQTRQGQCCLYQAWQDMSWMLAKLYRFGYEATVADEQLAVPRPLAAAAPTVKSFLKKPTKPTTRSSLL